MHKSVLVLFGILSVVEVSAVAFRDYDQIDKLLNGGSKTYVSGNFNIAAGDGGAGDLWGYSSAGYTITSATATFGISANGASTKQFTVDLGALGTPELNSGTFSSSFTFGGTDNIMASATLLADLSVDGILAYKVIQSAGTFTLNYAQLVVTASPKAATPALVPDAGSTAGLMATALLGIATLRRRFKA